ncbi:hypothetical protein HY989_02575 [Candidatus Micrarchaeota archaeon]|nr:hypothetical protein [Candidatus Micrarchaeota archaeon]
MAKKGISQHYDQTGFRFSIMVLAILALVALYVTTPSNSGGFYDGSSLGRSNLVGQAIASKTAQVQATAPQTYICSDGTYSNKCSYNKPSFCSSTGQLANNCIKCGCPTGKFCSTGGSCVASSPLQLKTYIEDDLDYSVDTVRYTTQSSRFGSTTSSFSPSAGPKQVTKDTYPALALPNNGLIYSASGISVTENQNIYLFSYTKYDETAKLVQGQFAKTGYEAVFTSPLPLCLDTTKNVYSCPASKRLSASKIKVWLLGSSWYVSGYTFGNGTGNGTNTTVVQSLTLTREDGKTLLLTSAQEISGSKNWKPQFVSATIGQSLAISKIQLYNDLDQAYKTPVTQTLNAGEGIDIIKGLPGYKFNYLGIEAANFDNLQFNIQKAQSFTDSQGNLFTGDFLLVSSGISNAFQFPGISTSQAYIGLEGSTNNNTGGNGTNNSQNIAGKVFYLDASGYMKAYWSNGVTYHYSPSESAEIATSLYYTDVIIRLAERTEDNANAYAYPSTSWHFNLYYDSNYNQFKDSGGVYVNFVDKVGYSFGSSPDVFVNKEQGFISNRGTVFNSISQYSASFSYPTSIVHALYSVNYNGDDIVWPEGAVNSKIT